MFSIKKMIWFASSSLHISGDGEINGNGSLQPSLNSSSYFKMRDIYHQANISQRAAAGVFLIYPSLRSPDARAYYCITISLYQQWLYPCDWCECKIKSC